ncbi:MAG: glycosyl transferase family 1 [Anaerolineaceae bacterium]|nr:glycosyl transferase family 1 [Anaerolineaceae bacterium]
MRILMAHNYYQQRGGEDEATEQEIALLRRKGHEVTQFFFRNDEINNYSWLDKGSLAINTIWRSEIYKQTREIINDFHPDVVHVQNFFPLISPAIFFACEREKIPVVQTLWNYRLLCPNGLFLREGRICQDCAGKMFAWPGILHRCYRNSRSQTAVVALMASVHKSLGTWRNRIGLYIAPTEFVKREFIKNGLPAKKIVVKPPFVYPDPGMKIDGGDYALFVGRLTAEKGIMLLVEAWANVKTLDLKVVGDGPLKHKVQGIIKEKEQHNVELVGWRSYEEVIALIKGARFLIFPSECFETFGRVAIEAFACHVPVIASRLGTMAEIVEDGKTGLHFENGNLLDLVQKIHWAIAHPQALTLMGQNARSEFNTKYTAERNYHQLMNIYQRAINSS